jgi:hypothetical protein
MDRPRKGIFPRTNGAYPPSTAGPSVGIRSGFGESCTYRLGEGSSSSAYQADRTECNLCPPGVRPSFFPRSPLSPLDAMTVRWRGCYILTEKVRDNGRTATNEVPRQGQSPSTHHMRDEVKTKKELIRELHMLRGRIAELERSAREMTRIGKALAPDGSTSEPHQEIETLKRQMEFILGATKRRGSISSMPISTSVT